MNQNKILNVLFCDDRIFPAQYNIFSYETSDTMRMNIIEIHNIIVKPVATRLAVDRLLGSSANSS